MWNLGNWVWKYRDTKNIGVTWKKEICCNLETRLSYVTGHQPLLLAWEWPFYTPLIVDKSNCSV
jgi:hypothetical protein